MSPLKVLSSIACCLLLVALLYVLFDNPVKIPYRFFGSKTSYVLTADLDPSPVSVPGCHKEMFWFVGRHGARCPDEEWTEIMTARLPAIRDRIVQAWEAAGGLEEFIVELRRWKFGARREEAMQLTDSGRAEYEEMGKRWRKRMGKVLGDRRKVLVRTTKTERTRESARFFLKGLFEEEINEENKEDMLMVPPSPDKEDDLLLRFFENCPKYKKDVLNNIVNETAPEGYKLEQTDEYKVMLEEVRLKAGVNLSSSDIMWMWQICGFEMAWWPNMESPWCQLFTEDNLKVLEYREDLTSYYKLAYAHPINWKITQKLFSDIFSKFEAVRGGKSEYTGVVYLGHLETVGPLLTALGLYRDKRDLLASDWPNKDYKWRTSQLTPFAANLELILLRCQPQEGLQLEAQPEEGIQWKNEGKEGIQLKTEGKEGIQLKNEGKKGIQLKNEGKEGIQLKDEGKEGIQWKVMVRHNEKMVKLPVCEEDICDMDQFLNYYSHFKEIDFGSLCSVH